MHAPFCFPGGSQPWDFKMFLAGRLPEILATTARSEGFWRFSPRTFGNPRVGNHGSKRHGVTRVGFNLLVALWVTSAILGWILEPSKGGQGRNSPFFET